MNTFNSAASLYLERGEPQQTKRSNEMTTITLTTASGTNASAIGDAYAGYDGVQKWRDSIDNCDDIGAGRVFLD